MSQNDSHATFTTNYPNPIHEPKHLKIICVGAGASGLLLAYKLQRSFDNFELMIYEKNEDISGTWLENTYPGCACDIPAHVYTYTFEPNPNWSSVYSGSREIRDYFLSFAKKYELHKYIKLRHQVSGAVWNDKTGQWDVDIANLENGSVMHDSCDIFISAVGVLNAWKWPTIPGLHDFKGPVLHTARWDSSVNLEGKHVGLIGNGSSGIQVLPAISPEVAKITTFIRSPTWVSPTRGFESRIYPEEERQKYASDPQAHLAYRKTLEKNMNELFQIFITDSPGQKQTFDAMKKMMQDKLQISDDLQKLVIPTWPVGCRRLTPGIGYLEMLASDKVEVVFGEIEKITAKGCVSTGQEYPIDVLICATGFDTSFKPRFPLIGLGGKNLQDAWASEAQSYLGIAAHGFPNYFMFIGPNSPSGNGPLLVAMEAQADYMLRMINRWQTENIHSFSPKIDAVQDFIAFKDEFMKATVWEHECKSWYKNNSASGKVTALWPGSTLHYLEAISDPRYEDWDFKYKGNRFAFLGNGRSQVESDSTADWAYYIRNEDDGPYLGRLKQTKIVARSGTVIPADIQSKPRYGSQ
ncbi:hypothetical protein HYPSUDRAFT_66239 [Hypholoma sublateritium FD-334 SS-4]|uniref:FAD/NAD(P)-binding domain-containing protein n=1 Tax=Hypholoma sublateritium (strain FD-334 SS-4) TaxID=945553 RepID=A0A0D2NXR3_HYPSF|nr:hypothetical protein HYPSUDRAFT_66239 [Hypholoma sublateritium FD-334 SS-4]